MCQYVSEFEGVFVCAVANNLKSIAEVEMRVYKYVEKFEVEGVQEKSTDR